MPSAATPPNCALEHWDSNEVDPQIRLPYWHDIAHNWVDVQPLSTGTELEASWSLLRGQNSFLGTKRSTAYEMRTNAKHVPPGEDMVVLSFLESGQLDFNSTPGQGHRAQAGTLGIYDPRQEGAYRWSQHARQTYIAIERSVVWEALGHKPSNIFLSPQQCALAPMLSSQLVHVGRLARQSSASTGLDAQDFAGLLEGTRALALLLLRNIGNQGLACDMPDQHTNLHTGRYAAALRFMEQNAHYSHLGAATIAHGTSCSRTRLYEAFAAHGKTVMGTLRELRLQRARLAIEQSQRLHVGTIAWRCGFVHTSDFSKLFKARFGFSPTDWHHYTRENRME
ncbi:MAG: AraC family transcriptional regulator [Brachymonas sp.]|jgi:AraC family transcriptional activator of tynA and feaB